MVHTLGEGVHCYGIRQNTMHAPSSNRVLRSLRTGAAQANTETSVQLVPRDRKREGESEEWTLKIRTHRGEYRKCASVDRGGIKFVDEKKMLAIENVEDINASHYERARRSLLAISHYSA